MEKQNSNNKQSPSWAISDLENLAKTLIVIANGQKAYGKEINPNDLLAYFKMKLEGRFTVEQVIYALQKYTDAKNDIPAPADIILILNPGKPRITEASFVEAQKWQERNGYSAFSDAKDIIDAYREQEFEKQENWLIENQEILKIAGASIKRIPN